MSSRSTWSAVAGQRDVRMQGHPDLVAAALFGMAGADMVDQHVAHGLGRQGQESPALADVQALAVQFQVGLMHQHRGVQGRARGPAQFAPGNPLQLVIELGETTAVGLAAIGQ